MLALVTDGADLVTVSGRTGHPVALRSGTRSRLARVLAYQFDVVAIGVKEIDRLAGDVRLDAFV
jgi:hypothetical protein